MCAHHDQLDVVFFRVLDVAYAGALEVRTRRSFSSARSAARRPKLARLPRWTSEETPALRAHTIRAIGVPIEGPLRMGGMRANDTDFSAPAGNVPLLASGDPQIAPRLSPT